MARFRFDRLKLRVGCFWATQILALVLTSSLLASFKPGPTPFVKVSSGGNYLLVMTPKDPSEYGDAQRWAKHYEVFPVSGVYSNDGENRLLWPIQEYWLEETVLAFIESGDAVYTARSDWHDQPLIFYKWDQELRSYGPQDLLDRPWFRSGTRSPFGWLHEHQVDVNRLELRVETTDAGVFVFDLTTGTVVTSNREPATVRAAGNFERDLVAKVSEAFNIFTGTHDWKEAPKYFGNSVLIECRDVLTRAEMAESVEGIEKQFGDRAAFLFQLFDVDSTRLALRGVTRLDLDDSRFDVYRIPYGQARGFLCGNQEIPKESGEWPEGTAYASVSEIQVNPRKLDVAVALGLVKADWRLDAREDVGLIAIWMQNPDWQIVGLTPGRIRFPKLEDK